MARTRDSTRVSTPNIPDAQRLYLQLEQLFQKNKAAIDELRGVVSEAHGVLGDLKREIKKAEQVGPAIVSKRLKIETAEAVKGLHLATDQAITETANQITRTFDRLLATLLAEDEPGKLSITEMIDMLGPLVPLIRRVMNNEVEIIEDKKSETLFLKEKQID